MSRQDNSGLQLSAARHRTVPILDQKPLLKHGVDSAERLDDDSAMVRRAASIFVAGLAVRLVAVAYLAKIKPQMLSWGAIEAGAIARSIVTNHSYSSPFHDASGPTAWLGPVYPVIVAGMFRLFGIQTSTSAVAVMIFNSVCSAATGIIIYEIGKEVYSERAGLFAGWMWAFSPYIAILPYILWDTSLSALLLAAAMLLTLKLESGRIVNWAVCGATWGVVALINPALITPLPVVALLLSRRWKYVCVMALFTVIVITPWTVRNYLVFHEVLPIRSNGLAEVYFANLGFASHPLGPSMEYQRLGEAAFTAQANRLAIEYIRANPWTFVSHSLRRAVLFWIYPVNCWPFVVMIDLAALAGLLVAFRNSKALPLPILAVLAVYPLVFYASQVVSRYRHPIDPFLYALAGIGMSSMSRRRT